MLYLPHTSTLCLTAEQVIGVIMPKATYSSLRERNKINVHGLGGNGRRVLIEYESLPEKPVNYKALVVATYGDPYQYASLQPLRHLINRVDVKMKARDFYDRHEKPNGEPLEDHLKDQYTKAATIMAMIDHCYENKNWLKKELKLEMVKFWEVVGEMPETKAAKLPGSARKLRPWYDRWKEHGHAGLVSGKVGNTNRLKADEAVVNLVLSLYTDKNKPYQLDVYEYYRKFLNGKVEMVDTETGELYNPADFEELSPSTIKNIINKNREVVDKLRISAHEYNGRHRPYNSRTSPVFAFSKLTMDDRSIPFKLEDGKRIWAYYIGDVASQCIVGRAFSRSNDDGSGKDRELFKASMMDMFRLIITKGWGMPAEIEVEHHISNTFVGKTNEDGTLTPDLLTNDFLYKYVTFCNPANPQQKRAEHIFRGIKYQKEKDLKGFIGRFYARLDSNRVNQDKALYKYAFQELQAEMNAAISDWNNDLHPNQSLYPGLTRWQVLESHQNPNLLQLHLPTIVRYIGQFAATSINRTEVKAFNDTYIVPITSGLHNGAIVTAWALPSEDIKEVYLYQEDKFIATAKKKGRYNEAKAERTEADEQIRTDQAKHTSQFDATVRKRIADLKKVKILQPYTESPDPIEPPPHFPEQSAMDSSPLSNLVGEGSGGEVENTGIENKALNDL